MHEAIAPGADGLDRAISVIVEPIEANLTVVAFRELTPVGGPEAPSVEGETSSRQAHELRATKAQIKAAVSELETYMEEAKLATEEMQSVNEELQSANEELETSKEEMQSINEELQTLNGELQNKNASLARAKAPQRGRTQRAAARALGCPGRLGMVLANPFHAVTQGTSLLLHVPDVGSKDSSSRRRLHSWAHPCCTSPRMGQRGASLLRRNQGAGLEIALLPLSSIGNGPDGKLSASASGTNRRIAAAHHSVSCSGHKRTKSERRSIS